MIQTRPYEFMVQYTPQREWIDRRGILLWLAFYFIEVGAGTFFVASFLDNWPGMLVGWLICAVLGGGLHLLYLGRPLRVWRILISSGWKTSWLARGLYFVVFFLILGALYMFLAQWGSPVFGLLATTVFFAFLTIIYFGFLMSSVNAIPIWNTPLLVILYAVLGIWGGTGITLILTPAPAVREWVHIFLVSYAFILLVYLICIRYQGGTTGKVSVRQIVVGKWAPLFWIVSVALGIILPGGVAISTLVTGWTALNILGNISIICELLGDLALRYCILKCAFYGPLIPTTSYAF